jgi:glutamine cyclotransferase
MKPYKMPEAFIMKLRRYPIKKIRIMPIKLLNLLATAAAVTTLGATGQAPPGKVIHPATTVKTLSFVILNRYPHDSTAFTQGLQVISPQSFLESTGQYGRSTLREVEIKTGKVLSSATLDPKYFGEGAVKIKDSIFQLTWQEGVILEWNHGKSGFTVRKRHPVAGEGWGLTFDGTNLWMSDGSDELRALEPKSLRETRRIKVTLLGQPLGKINELEWARGKIFANIWMSSTIARIEPKSGNVDGIMDISSLRPPGLIDDAVANGIAFDKATGHFFVTGKLWPYVYEIKIK